MSNVIYLGTNNDRFDHRSFWPYPHFFLLLPNYTLAEILRSIFLSLETEISALWFYYIMLLSSVVEDVTDCELLTINTHFQIYQTEESAGSQREGQALESKDKGLRPASTTYLLQNLGEVNHLA